MSFPLILTNYKNYPSAIGQNALALSAVHAQVARETGKNFAVAVSALDIREVAREFGADIGVFAQHVDESGYGSSTGKIVAEEIRALGATGTILNHSESRVEHMESLGKKIESAKSAGLVVVVCAENAEEGARIMESFAPDLVAVEPPELIGGDISVSTAQPELISDSVRQIGEGNVLVGAGVKNGDDVRIACELGAVGVLLASGVTKADDPEAVLRDLVSQI